MASSHVVRPLNDIIIITITIDIAVIARKCGYNISFLLANAQPPPPPHGCQIPVVCQFAMLVSGEHLGLIFANQFRQLLRKSY